MSRGVAIGLGLRLSGPWPPCLLGAVKGLFLARAVNGAVTIAPAGDADTGPVRGMRDLPGGALRVIDLLIAPRVHVAWPQS
jgi:hypothetical protein